MYRSLLIGISLIVAVINNSIAAQSIEFAQPISAYVKITKSNNKKLNDQKKIILMNIKLTPEQKHQLLAYSPKMSFSRQSYSSLPQKISLGMNGVPVLDQGQHGSCVTFAITAALDALIGKGDHISQLCNLELGTYLSERGNVPHMLPPSGWWGSSGSIVLNQINLFGYVTKLTQHDKSCAGMTEYPLQDEDNMGKPMSLDEFFSKHEAAGLRWEPILSIFERFDSAEWVQKDPINPEIYDGEKILFQVKQALATAASKDKGKGPAGYVTFGVFIPLDLCNIGAGACAKYHVLGDTWVVTQEMDHVDPEHDDPHTFGGHEMIITGYDDNAIAIDNNGMQHRGLFMIRNSWGNDVGDNGDFYMTYDFFKKFIFEAQRVYKVF